MTSGTFDFAPLLPAGLPAPAAKWAGLAKYSFVGGNNDPDQVPVEGLIDAVNAVLRREGRTLATYGLASGPQGYRPLREFLTRKLKRDAGIDCVADDILIVSGSLQALDLVNATLLARGVTARALEQPDATVTLVLLIEMKGDGGHPALVLLARPVDVEVAKAGDLRRRSGQGAANDLVEQELRPAVDVERPLEFGLLAKRRRAAVGRGR